MLFYHSGSAQLSIAGSKNRRKKAAYGEGFEKVIRTQVFVIYILLLVAIFLSGCGTTKRLAGEGDSDFEKNQYSTMWPRQGSRIEVFYSWGYESRNRIDTVSGTITKDLFADGRLTVPFNLSDKQKMEIVAYADSIMFWAWPDALFVPDPSGVVTIKSPCMKQVLQIKKGGFTKTVVWDNCRTTKSDQLQLRETIAPLGELIEKMVLGSETYKNLPPSKGSVY